MQNSTEDFSTIDTIQPAPPLKRVPCNNEMQQRKYNGYGILVKKLAIF